MSRIELSKIRALTFYRDELTAARRTSPIQQLSCRGYACKLFQPEVVRCQNAGGYGTEVDWKCEADLPSSLRFGKVEVSCEGWDGPGDPYVLKGSCGLQYRLVQLDDSLRDSKSPILSSQGFDWLGAIFYALWIAILVGILYAFVKSCVRGSFSNRTPRTGPAAGGNAPGFNPPGSFGSDPPPPYGFDGNPKPSSGSGTSSAWSPGFWSGMALGGIGSHLLGNRSRNNDSRQYDWERERERERTQPRQSWFGGQSSSSSSRRRDDNRGEGSSNLGSMRTATTYGGSNVR